MRIAASVLGDKEPIVFTECPVDRFGECSVNVRRSCSVCSAAGFVGIGSPAFNLRSSWSIWSSWDCEICDDRPRFSGSMPRALSLSYSAVRPIPNRSASPETGTESMM